MTRFFKVFSGLSFLLVAFAVHCSTSEPIQPEQIHSASGASPSSGGSAGNGANLAGQGGSGSAGKGDPLAGNGGGGTAGNKPTGSCPSKEMTSPMVLLSLPGTKPFCLDTTEVTIAQYWAFVSDKTAEINKLAPPVCNLNDIWIPQDPAAGEPCNPTLLDPVNRADFPMECADWCDAATYCAWAGKRLCGGEGGKFLTLEEARKGIDEWSMACSQGGLQKYSYGNEFNPEAAVMRDSPGQQQASGALSEKASRNASSKNHGFESIVHLSGNVSEWINSCENQEPGNPSCIVRGGAYSLVGDSRKNSTCSSEGLVSRHSVTVGHGIRCCADPIE